MIDKLNPQTSSVGAVWPPEPASNERLKGFYDQVLQDELDAQTFTSEFGKYLSDAVGHPNIDRVSIRVVANTALIPELELAPIELEAAMPIRNNQDQMIFYVGWNDRPRRMSASYFGQHAELLTQTARRASDRQAGIDRLGDSGFTANYLGPDTSDAQKKGLVGQFTDLYGAFGYNQSEVEELLTNPANTIAYVSDGNRAVSTAMAEHAAIQVDGTSDLAIAEITEAFTLPEYREQGLYRSISGFLIERLLAEDEPLDVIYGESNLAMPGVVIAAHQNGRRLSYLDRDVLGVANPAFGILQQNFSIDDGVEKRPYNDFALSYVPLGT